MADHAVNSLDRKKKLIPRRLIMEVIVEVKSEAKIEVERKMDSDGEWRQCARRKERMKHIQGELPRDRAYIEPDTTHQSHAYPVT